MRISSRIALNALSSWALSGVQVLIGLILVPFLLGQLGKAGYGLIALVGAVVGFTALADLGLRAGLGRHLAEQVAKKDAKRLNELVSTAMSAYIVIGILCAGIIFKAAPLLVRVFRAPDELVPQAVFLVRWYGGISVLLAFVGPAFKAVLVSHNRFDISNGIEAGSSILRGVGLLAVLALTHTGLHGWACVLIVTEVAAFLAQRQAAHHVFPDLRIRLTNVRLNALLPLLSLGRKMFVFQMTHLVSVQADPIIITRFFGPGGVALYNPGLRLPTLARRVVTALSSQLYPTATDCHVTGKVEQLQAILIRGTRYTLLMGIAVSVVLAVFAEPIMRLWIGGTPVGEDYRTTAFVLVGWAIIDLLNYAGGTQWPVLLGMNRLKFVVWTQVGSGLVNVLASIYLVGYTSAGIIGVVIPTVIITAIRRPIIAVYTAWACRLSAKSYFVQSYLRPLAVLLMLSAVALLLRLLVVPTSLGSLACCAGSVALLWMTLCWWIGFDRGDRESALGILRPALTRIGLASPG